MRLMFVGFKMLVGARLSQRPCASPAGQGMVPFYRESRPELIDLALRVPAPPEATTLDEAYARIRAAL